MITIVCWISVWLVDQAFCEQEITIIDSYTLALVASNWLLLKFSQNNYKQAVKQEKACLLTAR